MDYMEMSRKKRVAEAKSDLIGAIYGSELMDLLESGKTQTSGERDAWNAFSEGLKSVAGSASVKKQNDVEDLVQNFGNEREETGFRIGFHTAMRLCMEGLNGGAVI